MNIDIRKLRNYLIDYYGTAMSNGFPMAIVNLAKIENASGDELIEIADSLGIDLEDFQDFDDYER